MKHANYVQGEMQAAGQKYSRKTLPKYGRGKKAKSKGRR